MSICGSSGSWWVRFLLLLAVVTAISHARTINCRVNVFHARCRGVSRRSGAMPTATVGDSGELRRFLQSYLSNQSQTRKLRALEHYLASDYPGHPSAGETATLLDRLLPTLEESDDYNSDM